MAAQTREERGIVSAHEAGMHDRKPKPEVCRLCKKEADMAKQRTQCQCGGTFDGTPSGRKAHEQTAKHKDWSAGQMAQAVHDRHAGATTPPTTETPVLVAPEASGKVLDVVAGLTMLIDRGAIELAARQRSHTWSKNHQTAEQAAAYYAKKVEPLREEQTILRAARHTVALERAAAKELLEFLDNASWIDDAPTMWAELDDAKDKLWEAIR